MAKLCAPLKLIAETFEALALFAKASKFATKLALVSLKVIAVTLALASAAELAVILATVAPLTVKPTVESSLLMAVASAVNCLKLIPTLVAPPDSAMELSFPLAATFCKASNEVATLAALSTIDTLATLVLAVTVPALAANTLVTL